MAIFEDEYDQSILSLKTVSNNKSWDSVILTYLDW